LEMLSTSDKLHFQITKIKDATFEAMQKAVRAHIARVQIRDAGTNGSATGFPGPARARPSD
jgi:hypothetical protein